MQCPAAQAIKEHVTGWIASFPDLRFSIEQMLSEGDRVAMQLLMEGTHQGAWPGIPASGKEDADTDVYRPPRRARQDRRGLGACGISPHLSATWSCPEHSGLGGQFLASAKQLLIPAAIRKGPCSDFQERG
jgi:hypothetical protein